MISRKRKAEQDEGDDRQYGVEQQEGEQAKGNVSRPTPGAIQGELAEHISVSSLKHSESSLKLYTNSNRLKTKIIFKKTTRLTQEGKHMTDIRIFSIKNKNLLNVQQTNLSSAEIIDSNKRDLENLKINTKSKDQMTSQSHIKDTVHR